MSDTPIPIFFLQEQVDNDEKHLFQTKAIPPPLQLSSGCYFFSPLITSALMDTTLYAYIGEVVSLFYKFITLL
jgi:hypothetical protein